MSGFLFDDVIKVVQVDADGKKYDKVSRVEAQSQGGETDIVLDINSQLYPVNKDELHRMVLSRTLALDGSDSYPEGKQKSLADKFEYVMHGVLYKIEEDPSNVVAHFSFGGLQLKLSSEPSNMKKFKLDQRPFLLLRKM